MVLQPGCGPIRAAYLPADVDTVLWGRLPCATDAPVLTVEPGTEVTFDTISHEGILEDQGRDPAAFFGAHGAADVLDFDISQVVDLVKGVHARIRKSDFPAVP